MGATNIQTTIRIKRLYKFKKKWMIQKANRVVALMNEVINSDEFGKEVIEFNYTDTRYRLDPTSEYREISSGEEILNILRKGHEQNSQAGNDYKWELEIKLGRMGSVVGSRLGNLITTQNWFMKQQGNDHQVASHWFHEYAHVLGFHHDKGATDIRPNSVPYALNTIVERVLESNQTIKR